MAKKTVTKSDLVDMLAAESAMSKKAAKDFVDRFVDALARALASGNKVTLTGFGTFAVRTRKARTGVRPGTTMKIRIPATKYPAFKAGKALKASVR